MDLRMYSRLGVLLFGLAPTTILLLLSFIPLGISLSFIFDDTYDFSILMLALPFGGIFGYLGMLSICFNIPISKIQKITCLIIGIVTISYVAIGGIPDFNIPYNIGYRFWFGYAFVAPLVVAIYHLFQMFRSGKSVT